jgi:hypothetical protein
MIKGEVYKNEGYQLMGAAFEVYNDRGYGLAEDGNESFSQSSLSQLAWSLQTRRYTKALFLLAERRTKRFLSLIKSIPIRKAWIELID